MASFWYEFFRLISGCFGVEVAEENEDRRHLFRPAGGEAEVERYRNKTPAWGASSSSSPSHAPPPSFSPHPPAPAAEKVAKTVQHSDYYRSPRVPDGSSTTNPPAKQPQAPQLGKSPPPRPNPAGRDPLAVPIVITAVPAESVRKSLEKLLVMPESFKRVAGGEAVVVEKYRNNTPARGASSSSSSSSPSHAPPPSFSLHPPAPAAEKVAKTAQHSDYYRSPRVPAGSSTINPPAKQPQAPQPGKSSPPRPNPAGRFNTPARGASSSSFYSPSCSCSHPPPAPAQSAKPTQRSDYDRSRPGLPKKTTTLPVYRIPEHLKELIEKDKVPELLTRPLSPSTYADYFATLLYAEDFYLEKWSEFLLQQVPLKLYEEPFQKARGKKSTKKYVAFEIDSVPERRPYLLSRDFIFAKPLDRKARPFEGFFCRVVKRTTVLAEFRDDFHSQHSPTKKYDVSFSFNRVCLKRSHFAVMAALAPTLQSILFPTPISGMNFGPSAQDRVSVIKHIQNLKGSSPYLIEGPRSVDPISTHDSEVKLSIVGAIIIEAILQIYRTLNSCRILICTTTNRTCDALTKSLLKEIPEPKLFRANAAFREYEHVPDDILSSCLYEGECFTCPPLSELKRFKVITSTFMSSFRLHCAGIDANHFSHIFLVDASSSTEPETIVALTNLVNEKTAIVVSGTLQYEPSYVRSDIARKYGLKKSYFHRLLEREPYLSRDPMFMADLG